MVLVVSRFLARNRRSAVPLCSDLHRIAAHHFLELHDPSSRIRSPLCSGSSFRSLDLARNALLLPVFGLISRGEGGGSVDFGRVVNELNQDHLEYLTLSSCEHCVPALFWCYVWAIWKSNDAAALYQPIRDGHRRDNRLRSTFRSRSNLPSQWHMESVLPRLRMSLKKQHGSAYTAGQPSQFAFACCSLLFPLCRDRLSMSVVFKSTSVSST
jgi:hypothetical protein